jgi:hypothetical protein
MKKGDLYDNKTGKVWMVFNLLIHLEDMCALDIDYDTLSDEEEDRRKTVYKHRLDNLSKKI